MHENRLSGVAAMSFPWLSERHCMRQNECMASISGRNNIYPFGMIPLSGGKSARLYAEEIKNYGLCGIGEIAFYSGGMNESNKNHLRDVLEASVEFALPVCLHLNEPVGHRYPGKYDPSFEAVYQLLSEVPAARVVLSHWGGGLFFYELMPEVRDALKNVYYDTAATPYLYRGEIYSAALKIIAAEKILFGSDYPLLGIDRYKGIIEKEISLPEDREKILGVNARKILNI
jgi:hypothetical protein